MITSDAKIKLVTLQSRFQKFELNVKLLRKIQAASKVSKIFTRLCVEILH